MGCSSRSKKSKTNSELDELSIKILKALANETEPLGCGDIARKINENVRRVMGKLRSLKNKGLVEQPVKGKYTISEKGKSKIK